nr:variant-silencing SET domain-containing protein-like [Ipomoea batatas]
MTNQLGVLRDFHTEIFISLLPLNGNDVNSILLELSTQGSKITGDDNQAMEVYGLIMGGDGGSSGEVANNSYEYDGDAFTTFKDDAKMFRTKSSVTAISTSDDSLRGAQSSAGRIIGLSGGEAVRELAEFELKVKKKMSSGGGKKGPPKHQNRFAWKPNAGKKINETEPGGRFRPLSEITGVCLRCKEQIDWKRKYGKYKPLAEPAKW